MTSGPPLIPSRDALRALRKLALSTPAVFAGATGSACGLAVVQYNTQHKLRLAEDVVKTKRTLHSISRGRGNAHISRMFDAAERGDSFLLDPHAFKRRRQRRTYGALATERTTADELYTDNGRSQSLSENKRPEWQPYESERKDSQATRSNRGSSLPDQTQGKNRQWRKRQQTTERPRNRPWRSHPRFSRDATDEEFLPSEYNEGDELETSYDPDLPADLAPQAVDIDNDSLHTWLPTDSRWLWEENHCEKAGHKAQSLQPKSETLTVQRNTDLHPVKKSSATTSHSPRRDRDGHASGYPPTSSKRPFDGWSAASGVLDFSNTEHPVRPDQAVPPRSKVDSSAKDAEGSQIVSSEEQIETKHMLPPTHPNGTVTRPPHNFHREDAPSPSSTEKLHYLLRSMHHSLRADRTDAMSNFVQKRMGTFGVEEAYELLKQALRTYTVTGLPSDWHLTRILVVCLASALPIKMVRPAIFRLVQEELQREDPFTPVAALLYPGCGMTNVKRDARFYTYARMYLDHFCNNHPDPKLQIAHTEMVCEGTRDARIPVSEEILVPVVRSLSASGEIRLAHRMVTHLSSTYEFDLTFYTFTEVIRGYVTGHDWTEIDRLLEGLHREQLSRKKVTGYAALVRLALREYSKIKSPEKVYDFLTYYVHGYGLIPNSTVSNTAIAAFIRARRFDLIQDWVQEMQEKFPEVVASSSTSAAALEVGMAWKQMQASCEEVLDTCRALAYRALSDPFSKVFRSVTREAVLRDMFGRMQALGAEVGDRGDVAWIRKPRDLKEVFDGSQRLVEAISASPVMTPKCRLLVEDLARQLKGIQQLNAIFHGARPGEQHYEPSLQNQHAFETYTEPAFHDEDAAQYDAEILAMIPEFPAALTADLLPHIGEIEREVLNYYTGVERQGSHADHTILRYISKRLTQLQRHPHALMMIQSVYQSRWVGGPKGTPFDLSLFTAWLELAHVLRDPVSFHRVLWAVVDCDAGVEIDVLFVLLTRMAELRTHDHRTKVFDEGLTREARYLKQRIKRRIWEQSGRMPNSEISMFADWQYDSF